MVHKVLKILTNNWLIVLITIFALFLRLYKISDYMTFLGDEGRDAIVWLRMVRDHKLTLIGPVTSIGNMYLGPLYYYLMAPFYYLFGLSPVGSSIGVALFSGLTVILIWYVGKTWFNEKAGLIASFFYSISPVVLYYSRSSWNPNVMPFFALICMIGIREVWQNHKYYWLIIIGISISFAIQSHYLGLLLLPTILLFWVLTMVSIKRGKKSFKGFFLNTFFAVIAFLFLTILPLVLFDLRHNFINFQSFQKFFGERQATVNFKIYKAIPNFWPLWKTVVIRLVAGHKIFFGQYLSLGFLVMVFLKRKTFFVKKEFLLCFVWLLFGLGGLGLYKQNIYDHYFGFLFPVIFLLLGYFLSTLLTFGLKGKFVSIATMVFLLVFNLQINPLKSQPNMQFNKVQEIDRLILKEANGKPFNFALIAKQNYDAGYTYFFDYWKSNFVFIDAQKTGETIADQLFVVCEDEICQPLAHPKAEIANFGWAKIENEWQFPWGVKVFKLIHQ